MPGITIANSNSIENKDLNKLIDKTTEFLILSSVQALNAQINDRVYKFKAADIRVGGREERSYPSVASVVSEQYAILDKSSHRRIARSLGRDASITSSIRRHVVDMRSSVSILDQIDVKKHYAFINAESFSENSLQGMAASLSTSVSPISSVSSAEALRYDLTSLAHRYGPMLSTSMINEIFARAPRPAVVNKSVQFRVHQVKCIDETNPEWWGHDEIAWGGVAVDDKEISTKLSEYYVGGGFDDGDKKDYAPPMTLHTFALGADDYPKTLMVSLALAEKDSNGLSAFIQKLWEAIKAHVQKILITLGAAAGAAIGTSVGGSIGTAIAGPLGTIIGAVAGAIIGALVAWLIGAFKDDIFPPQASSITLNAPDDTFGGNGLVSPRMYFHYRDHGGHYRVKYDWAIVR